jgi:hypothetical protein
MKPALRAADVPLCAAAKAADYRKHTHLFMTQIGARSKTQGANALMLWVPRNRSSAPRALPL